MSLTGVKWRWHGHKIVRIRSEKKTGSGRKEKRWIGWIGSVQEKD